MTRDQDQWGRDPSVQSLRRVFAGMEAGQKEVLRRLNISSLDARLRSWRGEARSLFERSWPLASRKGLVASEEETASLYLHCLVRVLRSSGIEVPDGVVAEDEKIIGFLNGSLP